LTEDFLQYCYAEKILGKYFLTTEQKAIEIIDFGEHNFNAGPDFLNAKIKYENKFWAGHIEFHVKASDWFKHKHQDDPSYKNIIAHFVYEDDAEVKSGEYTLPTVNLFQLVDLAAFAYFKSKMQAKKGIPCESFLRAEGTEEIEHMKSSLVARRLQRKAKRVDQNLRIQSDDRMAMMLQLIAETLGGKVNKEPFIHLVQQIHYAWLGKLNYDEDKITALLFGLAGYLSEEHEDDYYCSLRKEFLFLKHLFQLKEMPVTSWKYSRMRPTSFPEMRIAQMAKLLSKIPELKLSKFELNSFKKFLSIQLHPYWQNHYRWFRETKQKSTRISPQMQNLIVINAICPYLYEIGILEDEQAHKDQAFEILKQLKPEQNSIINYWSKFHVHVNSSWDTQALIELKNERCNQKKCLFCKVGRLFLKA
jgi:hypothetical protein